MRTVEYLPGVVRLVDQTALPARLEFVECRDVECVACAIRSMRVRGAPAIGATAAFGLALVAERSTATDSAVWLSELERAAELLKSTRPTAVNLSWAVDRTMEVARAAAPVGTASAAQSVRDFAQALADDDVAVNRRIGITALPLVPPGARILTHCNAGALATVDYGTALGVVRAAHAAGRVQRVLVDETRPFLQGARLTAWELEQEGIPYTLITDSMAGYFLNRKQVDLVVVGADRVAANGDVANKIGTYTLAVLCKENRVPFYVAAPLSSIDLSLARGALIPIEERSEREVTHLAGQRIAPEGARAANPVFDVTPARYVTAIVTERGLARAPYTTSLKALFTEPAATAAGTESHRR